MSNFNELAKILAHEFAKGCNNSSLIGGVEKFVENWANRTRNPQNNPAVDQILDSLEGYAHAGRADRRAMIQRAVSIARDYETSYLRQPPSPIDLSNANPPLINERQGWKLKSARSQNYTVKYKGGHSAFDLHLQDFEKNKELLGTLYYDENGIGFETSDNVDNFIITWADFQHASSSRTGLIFRKISLVLETDRYPSIIFECKFADSLAFMLNQAIQSMLNEHRRIQESNQKKSEYKNLAQVSPSKFEAIIGELFEAMGYRVSRVGRAGDEGIDLICYSPQHELVVVQCKRFRGTVGSPVVQGFYGSMMHRKAGSGFIVTTGKFSIPARKFAEGKNITFIDGNNLRYLIAKHTSEDGTFLAKNSPPDEDPMLDY